MEITLEYLRTLVIENTFNSNISNIINYTEEIPYNHFSYIDKFNDYITINLWHFNNIRIVWDSSGCYKIMNLEEFKIYLKNN